MKRIEWLDSLRGIAMLSVIVGHIHSMSDKMILWVYAFHMPLFFIISGVVFRYEKYPNIITCVKENAKKLLVPYALLYLVNIPFWYLNKKMLGSSSATASDLIDGFIFSNQDLGTLSNGALWFLPCLFLVSVLFWLIVHLDKKGVLKIEASMILCFLAGWYLSTFHRDPACWHWATVPMATLFYWVGYSFGKIQAQFKRYFEFRNNSFLYVAIAVSVLAMGTWVAFANGKISMHANRYNEIAFAIMAALSISLGLAMLCMSLPKIWLLDFAGKNSIVYLGFHVPLIRFLENYPNTASFAANHAVMMVVVVFILLVPVTYLVNYLFPFIVGKSWKSRRC